MQRMFRWKECAIEPTCEDIANFYYPTGPCVVSKKHPIWKMAPGAGPPGADKRHWWTMGNKWDFSSKAFKDARKVIKEFVDKEVGGPIDVVCGYSQGAAAATQLLNDIFDGKNDSANLKCIHGAIFLGCPEDPKVSASVSNRVRSLHCNGNKDPLTKLSGAKKHAAQFEHDTFFEFDGTHDIRKPCADPFRRFLLTLQNGRATECERNAAAEAQTKKKADEEAVAAAAAAAKGAASGPKDALCDDSSGAVNAIAARFNAPLKIVIAGHTGKYASMMGEYELIAELFNEFPMWQMVGTEHFIYKRNINTPGKKRHNWTCSWNLKGRAEQGGPIFSNANGALPVSAVADNIKYGWWESDTKQSIWDASITWRAA